MHSTVALYLFLLHFGVILFEGEPGCFGAAAYLFDL